MCLFSSILLILPSLGMLPLTIMGMLLLWNFTAAGFSPHGTFTMISGDPFYLRFGEVGAQFDVSYRAILHFSSNHQLRDGFLVVHTRPGKLDAAHWHHRARFYIQRSDCIYFYFLPQWVELDEQPHCPQQYGCGGELSYFI